MDVRRCCACVRVRVCVRVCHQKKYKQSQFLLLIQRAFFPKTIVWRQEVKSGHKAVSAVQITVVTDKFGVSS